MKQTKQHVGARRVAQNDIETCENPDILFYTDGLGPCIGVCIAWNKWAGILHSADIFMDASDEVASLIKQAKKIIPATLVSKIHPVVCGGDDNDHSGVCNSQAEEDELNLHTRKCRAKILKLLKSAGFAEPYAVWSDDNETAAVFADLLNGVVYVEQDGSEVARWQIPQKAAHTRAKNKR